MVNERYITSHVQKDLGKKMVFLGGPRQVGKTFIAKALLKDQGSDQYYNWDSREDRRTLMARSWDRGQKLVVFDEIHKYRPWKSWLKGVFDTEQRPPAILVTGSARLNIFRRGDDSMLGRYFYYRLHPFSVKELVDHVMMPVDEAFLRLWERGGFPEPLISKEVIDAARWKRERLEKIIHEDVLMLENIRHLGSLELLVDLLRDRVGSPVSYQSLSEDLSVSPQTVKAWIGLLVRLYLVFIVPTFHRSMARAIKKQIKVYFYDYSEIDDPGLRFENMIAAHLLKEVHFIEDTTGERIALHTLRDKEKREVDFLITIKNKPTELIETKLSDDSFSASLVYYAARFPGVRSMQVVKDIARPKSSKSVRMLSGKDFLIDRTV